MRILMQRLIGHRQNADLNYNDKEICDYSNAHCVPTNKKQF